MDMEAQKRLLECVNEWEEAKRDADLKGKDLSRNILQGTSEEEIRRYKAMSLTLGESPENIRNVFLNGAMNEEELQVLGNLTGFVNQNWGRG